MILWKQNFSKVNVENYLEKGVISAWDTDNNDDRYVRLQTEKTGQFHNISCVSVPILLTQTKFQISSQLMPKYHYFTPRRN